MNSCPLKQITRKTVMLLALTHPSRSADLSNLDSERGHLGQMGYNLHQLNYRNSLDKGNQCPISFSLPSQTSQHCAQC